MWAAVKVPKHELREGTDEELALGTMGCEAHLVIRIEDTVIDVDAVVLDKDGTLLEIDPLWIGLDRRWLAGITERAGRPDLLSELRDALDIDDSGRLVPNGLAHSGTMAEAADAAVAVLRRHGVDESEEIVMAAGSDSRGFDPADIVPLGDVAGTLARLKEAGLGIAVVTSDDRQPTEKQLELLGVTTSVDLIVCADDAGIESKPSPQVLQRVIDALAVPASRMVMVGDAEIDMQTGRNGGAGVCIGVTGGGGDPVGADITIGTIESILTD